MGRSLEYRLAFGSSWLSFAHPLEAGRVDGAVVFHFILVPAAADAKQEPSLAHLVDRGNQLRGLNRVPLLHQQHATAELDGPCHLTRGSQHHERIHCVIVLSGQIAAAWEWRLAIRSRLVNWPSPLALLLEVAVPAARARS